MTDPIPTAEDLKELAAACLDEEVSLAARNHHQKENDQAQADYERAVKRRREAMVKVDCDTNLIRVGKS